MVDAVPGSGKSTTVLGIARAMPGRRVLVTTYNASIKHEMRGRAAGLPDVDIHTYHSLVQRYYGLRCENDRPMREAVEQDAPMSPRAPAPAVLVVDECQDMTPLFCTLVKKLLRDLRLAGHPDPVLCFLGDTMQAVNRYKGADPRFLSRADAVFGVDAAPMLLSRSYRLTRPMARFINRGLLGRERVVAGRDGPPVEMHVGTPFGTCVLWCYTRIMQLLKQGVRPEDIFVLCCSLKSPTAPWKRLENRLAASGVPCYFPSSDEADARPELMRGKIAITTIHQSKGRERDVVVTLGCFDEGFYRYCFAAAPRDACTELHFVAASRARRLLLVALSAQEAPLRFADFEALERDGTARVSGLGLHRMRPAAQHRQQHGGSREVKVTALTRHIPSDAEAALEGLVARCFREESPAAFRLELPSVARGSNGVMYDVAHINGLALAAMWEHGATGGCHIERHVRGCAAHKGGLVEAACGALPAELRGVSDFLRAAVIFEAASDGVHSRLHNLSGYDWLDGEDLSPAISAAGDAVRSAGGAPLRFEEPVQGPETRCSDGFRRWVSGSMDVAVGTSAGIELKCASALRFEHRLQALVYAVVSGREFRLVNLLTGQRLAVDPGAAPWDLVARLLDVKYAGDPGAEGDGFVASHCKPYAGRAVPGRAWPFIAA